MQFDLHLVESAHGLHQRLRPGGDGQADPPPVDGGPVRSDVADRRHDRFDVGVVGGDQFEPLSADLGLQLVGGALGDRRAAVDDDDVVGEPLGFLEVLGGQQQCRATVDEVGDHAPQVGAAARVETGRRLVQEQHRGTSDERVGEVEAAAHAT